MHLQDEIAHSILYQVQQQVQDVRLAMIGYIANVFEGQNVTVLMPSLRDENGASLVTPPIPLGSFMVGPNCGARYLPHGGATQLNPTAGEQVLVSIVERASGHGIVASLLWSDLQPPPEMPDATQMQPGELLIFNEFRSYVTMRATGNIEVHAQQDLVISSARNCTINAATGGSVTVAADIVNIDSNVGAVNIQGATTANIQATNAIVDASVSVTVAAPLVAVNGANVDIGVAANAFLFLATSAFLAAYNLHTHTNAGGVTGPPNTTVPLTPPFLTAATAAN